jgi:hypothetical protein
MCKVIVAARVQRWPHLAVVIQRPYMRNILIFIEIERVLQFYDHEFVIFYTSQWTLN